MIAIDTNKLNFFKKIHFCGTCRGFLSRDYAVRIGLRPQVDGEGFTATLVISDETEHECDFAEIEIELDEVFCPADLRVELSVAFDALNNPKSVFEAALPQLCQIEFIYTTDGKASVIVASADRKNHCMTKQMTAEIDPAVAKRFLLLR